LFKISLKNNKSFSCDGESTIFEAARKNNINLEYSCLSARCRSCIVKVISGSTVNIEEDLILTGRDKNENFVLSCNTKPTSDLKLDLEDLGDIKYFEKKIIPSKINYIEKLTDDVIKVVLRLPPNSNFKFNSGQYVNIVKGNLSRSYSISNSSNHKNQLDFFIKKYENGSMSQYWFEKARINDLLRIEGPVGTFFLRPSTMKNLVFLATGTGVAPIKSILEQLEENPEEYKMKNIWVLIGSRFRRDLFWQPKSNTLNIIYIPVLSREKNDWNGAKGYVQDVLLKQRIDFRDTQVYACGSNEMISLARKLLLKNNLNANNFFSDAFVETN